MFASTLVQKDLSDGFRAFIHGNGINHQVFDMAGTKKADIPLHMMQTIMDLLVDETNHPVLIHCKQGKHRTGCAVGVLRKYHGWDTRSVLAEYQSYAEPKVRETDIKYLSSFELMALSGVVPRKTRGAESYSPAGRCLFLFVTCCLVYFLWLMISYNKDSATAQAPPLRRGKAWQRLR
jgi:tyrosine-protein phosphatase SIW14